MIRRVSRFFLDWGPPRSSALPRDTPSRERLREGMWELSHALLWCACVVLTFTLSVLCFLMFAGVFQYIVDFFPEGIRRMIGFLLAAVYFLLAARTAQRFDSFVWQKVRNRKGA